MFQIKAVYLNEVFIHVLCASSFREIFSLDLSLSSTVNKWICCKVDNWHCISGRVKDVSLSQHVQIGPEMLPVWESRALPGRRACSCIVKADCSPVPNAKI